MSLLRKFSAAIDGLNERLGVTIRWLTLVMVLVGAVGAVLRYFSRGLGMSMNLTPLVEAQWYVFSIIFLMGAAYGLNKDVHVRVDVMFARLSERKRAWVDLIGSVFGLVPFCVLMLWVSWPPVATSWRVRETSPDPGGLPRYPIKALILVSFVLLMLQAFSHIVKQVEVLRRTGGDGGPHDREIAAPDADVPTTGDLA